MTDPRVQYWLEARQNILESHKHATATQGYWLNLAVAGVNALMASVSDSVMEDVMVELTREANLARMDQKTVQEKILRDLNGK